MDYFQRTIGAMVLFLFFGMIPLMIMKYYFDKMGENKGIKMFLVSMSIQLVPLIPCFVNAFAPIKYYKEIVTYNNQFGFIALGILILAFVYSFINKFRNKNRIARNRCNLIENIELFLIMFMILSEYASAMFFCLGNMNKKLELLFDENIKFMFETTNILLCIYSIVFSLTIIFYILVAVTQNDLNPKSIWLIIFPVRASNLRRDKLSFILKIIILCIFHFAVIYSSFHLLDICQEILNENNIKNELVKNFYYNVDSNFNMTKSIADFIDYLYFSTVTFATVGYGDMSASSIFTKLVVILEMLSTFSIVAIGISLFVGSSNDDKDKEKEESNLKQSTELKILKEILVTSYYQLKNLDESLMNQKSFLEVTAEISSEYEKLNLAPFEEVLNTLEEDLKQLKSNTSKELEDCYKNNEKANYLVKNINEYNTNMKQIRDSMISLDNQSLEINQVLDVANLINEKTNLLALNVSIEVSKVGEHGIGFSIVADEIRNLSNQTAKSTKDISLIVKNIKNEISHITSKSINADKINYYIDNDIKEIIKSQILSEKASNECLEKLDSILEEFKILHYYKEAIKREEYELVKVADIYIKVFEKLFCEISKQSNLVEKIINSLNCLDLEELK